MFSLFTSLIHLTSFLIVMLIRFHVQMIVYLLEHIVFCQENLVSCYSGQKTTPRSSIESEYHAIFSTDVELIQIKSLLGEFHTHVLSFPMISCDKFNAQVLTHNLVFHSRIKHIEIDYHFIKDQVLQHCLDVQHVFF